MIVTIWLQCLSLADREHLLDKHEYVHMSCVIGVKDPYKMQKVKAFVVLKPGVQPSEEVKNSIMDYCRKNIAKYAHALRHRIPR